MAVRNQSKAGKPGNYPVSHGPVFAKPGHNPKPTTDRGRRRRDKTKEYQDNLSTRQTQSGQHGKTSPEKRGPTKIPPKDEMGGAKGDGTCRYDHQKYIHDNGRTG